MNLKAPLVWALLVALLASPALGSKMVGGETHADPNDAESQKAAGMLLSTLNQGHNRENLGAAHGSLTLVTIKSVTTQVVAGLNYHLVLNVRDESGNTHDLAATIWSRPWLENRNDVNEPAWQVTKAWLLNNDS